MTNPVVINGKVNVTALMIGLRTDAERTLRELVAAGIHPRDVGVSPETARKHGVEYQNDPRDNPFRDGPRGGNLTDQHRAIKADPEAAFRQMLDAGREPAEWGIDLAAHGFTIVDKQETAT